MMHIGISTFVWVSPFSTASFDVLRKAKDVGYDVIEIAVEDRDLIDWVSLKKVSRELGLNVTVRTEEHTSELQYLIRLSYAVFCLKKKIKIKQETRLTR